MLMFDKRDMPRIREVVGVFMQEANRHDTMSELLQAGFDRASISALEKNEAMVRQFGLWFGKVSDLGEPGRPPRRAYVSPIDAGEHRPDHPLTLGLGTAAFSLLGGVGAAIGQGSLTYAVVGAVGGAAVGFFLCMIVARRWRQRSTRRLSEALMAGGRPLWVRTFDDVQVRKASAIMQANRAIGVHAHVAGLDPLAKVASIDAPAPKELPQAPRRTVRVLAPRENRTSWPD